MVRRSFRLGLWAGVLFGIGFAIVKTVQSRRASSVASTAGGEPWPPLIPTEPDRAAAAATATPTPPSAPAATTPQASSGAAPAAPPAVPAPVPSTHPAEAPRLEVVRDEPDGGGDSDGGMDEEEQAADLVGHLSSQEVEPEVPHHAAPPMAAPAREPSPAPTLHLVTEPASTPEPEVVAVAPAREPEPAPAQPTPPVAASPEPVTPEVAATPPATRPAKKAAAPAKKAAKQADKAAKATKKATGDALPPTSAAAPGEPRWVAPVSPDLCPETHPVKAKMSSRLFHLPGMLAYTRTRPDRCYENAESAVADGLTQAKR